MLVPAQSATGRSLSAASDHPSAPRARGGAQECLADWQVALLLGGTAVAGLASTLAALVGISWLV